MSILILKNANTQEKKAVIGLIDYGSIVSSHEQNYTKVAKLEGDFSVDFPDMEFKELIINEFDETLEVYELINGWWIQS